MIAFLTTYGVLLSIAIGLDTTIGAKLIQPKSSYLPLIRAPLISVTSMMVQRNLARSLLSVGLVFVFVLILNITVLAAFDQQTTSIILMLVRNNPADFLVLVIFCFLISLVSFHQSVFFMRLASSVKSLFGVFYLFVSDLLLSALIVLVGVSVLTTGYSLISTSDGRFQVEWYFESTCPQPCQVDLVAQEVNGIVMDSQIDGVSFPSLEHLSSAIDEVEFVSVDVFRKLDVAQQIQSFSEDRFSYNIRVAATVIPTHTDSSLTARFAVNLGYHISEFTNYFSKNFSHYSYVPLSFRPIEFHSNIDRSFWVFEFVNDPRVADFMKAIVLLEPSETDPALARHHSFVMDLIHVDNTGFGRLEPLVEQAYPDTSQQVLSYMKVLAISLSQINQSDSLKLSRDFASLMNGQKSILANELQQTMAEKMLQASYQEGGIYGHYVPFTSLFITTISFSSLFFLFLIAKLSSQYIGFLDKRFGDGVINYPFTTFVIVVLPRFLLGHWF
jgi:hypothetical protein